MAAGGEGLDVETGTSGLKKHPTLEDFEKNDRRIKRRRGP
jgi:hypothetical protein